MMAFTWIHFITIKEGDLRPQCGRVSLSFKLTLLKCDFCGWWCFILSLDDFGNLLGWGGGDWATHIGKVLCRVVCSPHSATGLHRTASLLLSHFLRDHMTKDTVNEFMWTGKNTLNGNGFYNSKRTNRQSSLNRGFR